MHIPLILLFSSPALPLLRHTRQSSSVNTVVPGISMLGRNKKLLNAGRRQRFDGQTKRLLQIKQTLNKRARFALADLPWSAYLVLPASSGERNSLRVRIYAFQFLLNMRRCISVTLQQCLNLERM